MGETLEVDTKLSRHIILLKIPLRQEFNPHQAGNQTATTTTFIHTIQVEEEEKREEKPYTVRVFLPQKTDSLPATKNVLVNLQ